MSKQIDTAMTDDVMATIQSDPALRAFFEAKEAENEKTLALAGRTEDRLRRRIDTLKETVAKQAESLGAKDNVISMTKAEHTVTEVVPDTLTQLFDAIYAETGRMNASVERNKDGSWPTVVDGNPGETKRYPFMAGMQMADRIASAVEGQMRDMPTRIGRDIPGIRSRLAALYAEIEDQVDKIQRNGGIEEASDQVVARLEFAIQRRDHLQTVEKAAMELRHAAEGAYVDASAGTVQSWVYYADRTREQTTPRKPSMDRAAIAKAAGL